MVDASRIKKEAEAKALSLGLNKPNLKASSVLAGDLTEGSWGEGAQARTHLFPGNYSNPYTAAAKALLKEMGATDAKYKLKPVGTVYEVLVEDMNEPCLMTSFGLPQTPRIEGTIKSKTH